MARLLSATLPLLVDPADPYRSFRAMHARGTVLRVGGVAVVVGHAAATSALKDPRLELRPPYPEHFGGPEGLGALSMNFANGPDHRRRRAVLARAFQPGVLAAHRPRMAALLDEIFRGFGRRKSVDIIADFARAFPVRVIGELLGVPREAHDRCLEWAEALAPFTDPALERAAMARMRTAGEAFVAFVDALIAERLRAPQHDLITELAQHLDRPDGLSHGELVSNVVALFLAGHETTTSLIASALELLQRHPAARAEIQASPELLAPALEEVMRFETPIQFAYRFATEPLALEGVDLAVGELAVVLFGAANRDPRCFADADRFDIHRAPNPHLAFSVGPHACLGAALARVEGQLALSMFFQRFPRWAVHTEQSVRRQTVALRSWQTMPAALR